MLKLVIDVHNIEINWNPHLPVFCYNYYVHKAIKVYISDFR